MNMVKLYGRPLTLRKSARKSDDDHNSDDKPSFFCKLFVGNLDEEVDDKMLYDVFSAFGAVLSAQSRWRERYSDVRSCVSFVLLFKWCK
jgi:splicing factor 3B subunit 4